MGSKLRKKLRLFLFKVRAFSSNTYGGMSVRGAIMIGISLFVVAIVFPLAMTEIVGANTTGWNSGVTTVFQTLLPVLGIIGIAIAYIKSR